MRLIDADELNSFIDKWLSKKCDEHGNTTPNEWLNSLKRCVEEQQTAYSIDKVVEELEKASWEETDISTVIYIDDAIEIVKHGGVADDMCEWRCDVYERWHTKCNILADNDPLEYTYCPYCGKKIKVVE